jgi:hypothetical protein
MTIGSSLVSRRALLQEPDLAYNQSCGKKGLAKLALRRVALLLVELGSATNRIYRHDQSPLKLKLQTFLNTLLAA